MFTLKDARNIIDEELPVDSLILSDCRLADIAGQAKDSGDLLNLVTLEVDNIVHNSDYNPASYLEYRNYETD